MAFETTDPAQTIASCVSALKARNVPILRWDCIRGLVSLNTTGNAFLATVAPVDKGGQEVTVDPVKCLELLAGYYAAFDNNASRRGAINDAIIFYMNAQRFISNAGVVQALWNILDTFKSHGSTLVMLAPAMSLPAELTHDVVVVTEPLPTAEEVAKIVDSITASANIESKVTAADKTKIVDTLLGLSSFAVEQVLAMSVTQGGFDRDELWERKRKMIEQTSGLSVWKDKGSFDDIGGLANIKGFLTKLLTSDKNPVRCIGFIDEIEKLFAGSQGDTSGVSQDQLRTLLTEMQDNNIPGIILLGPAGTGKSQIAKSAGAVADAEVLNIDTGAMTGSLVGESQAKIRHAFKTLKAVSQGKSLLICTCNSIGSLPPELRRRFSLGTFFVDLPSAEERTAIWKIWLKKYGFASKVELPEDTDWTGAEIRACCDVAFRTNSTLVEASTFIVPIAKSAADKIAALRQQAVGKFISASKPGVYEYDPTNSASDAQAPTTSGRKFTFESKKPSS